MAIPARIEYYRDVYGCTATIRHKPDGLWHMIVCTPHGIQIRCNSPYRSHKAARIALGKMSDGTMKLVKKED